MLALHGEEDDVVGLERDFGGGAYHREADQLGVGGGAEGEPAIVPDGRQHLAAGNADHVMAGRGEGRCKGAADGADAVDDEPHAELLWSSLAAMSVLNKAAQSRGVAGGGGHVPSACPTAGRTVTGQQPDGLRFPPEAEWDGRRLRRREV